MIIKMITEVPIGNLKQGPIIFMFDYYIPFNLNLPRKGAEP